jgi:hypothetical protein
MESSFNEALARLDADIAKAEQRLADLRLKRKGAEAFLVYMDTAKPSASRRAAPAKPRRTVNQGPADVVLSQMVPRKVYTVDSTMAIAAEAGHNLSREQTRNALHYLVRKKEIRSPSRGHWVLSDSGTPVAAGVPVGNHTEEGGGTRETTEAPASPAEDRVDLQLGASITEVAV